MFNINTLTVRNFMSIGNQTQAIDFNRDDLTLVIGENLDMGGDDAGARNGTGKTTIINALSYALFGSALTNIKKANLINKTNAKGMICTVEFSKNGTTYRVERGRKPTFLRFFIDEHEQAEDTNEAQGDSRRTQDHIEALMEMSHDMFKHVLALNTYTEPFLSMKAAPQRDIIEQLLGITLLSEKANVLKDDLRDVKDAVKEETYKINAQTAANDKIGETIKSLERQQKVWLRSREEAAVGLQNGLDALAHVDIKAEMKAHKDLVKWNADNTLYNELDKEYNHANKTEQRCMATYATADKNFETAKKNKCPTCEQELHSEDHMSLLEHLEKQYEIAEISHKEACDHITAVVDKMEDVTDPGDCPDVFYELHQDAVEHKSTIKHLKEKLQAKKKEQDPYEKQIDQLKTKAVVDIDFDTMNELTRLKDHQEFLLKLLTNKDSYIRKKIIDQNLAYLNNRLGYYLDKIGLPHTVEFQNDLSVEITEFGRDLDFDNLSRGERNRLILSLSWAFRDVWENLYQPINLLFIDELIDSGMDASGVESSISILKKISRERKKSVWLVSHKDDLMSRVNNVLTVTKENGFTSYNNDVEVR